MRKLQDILADLQKSAESDKEAAHYKTLKLYINRNDRENLLPHIASALPKSNWLGRSSATAYAQFLLELQTHFLLESTEEKNRRLDRLGLAIHDMDPFNANLDEVKDALERGGISVINETFADFRPPLKRGSSPLMMAVELQHKGLIELLLAHGASAQVFRDIDRPLNREGETALHIACRLGLNEWAAELLMQGANPNEIRADRATPLHLAIEAGNRELCALLLNKNANTKLKYSPRGEHKQYSAFALAIEKDQPLIALMILQKGYPYTHNEAEKVQEKAAEQKEFKSVLHEMKLPFKARKKAIMYASSQTNHLFATAKEKSFATDALVQQLYFENPAQKKATLAELEVLYQHENALLRPLLEVLRIATAGQRNLPSHHADVDKPFKIVVSRDGDVYPMTGFAEPNIKARGLQKRNTAYVAGKQREGTNVALGTLLHELKHFADQEIFGNASKPYNAEDKPQFKQVQSKLRARIEDGSLPTQTAADRAIYLSLEAIFKYYQPHQQDMELLVKVPEIIGRLGMETGYAWLQVNTPELLTYYETVFNPACEAYLAELKEKNTPAENPFHPK